MVSTSAHGKHTAGRARAAVRAAGYTQEAFAAKLGIRHGTLGRKLTARRSISTDELVEISNALGIRPSDLLIGADSDELEAC